MNALSDRIVISQSANLTGDIKINDNYKLN
jgi:hypothetical protein